MTERPLLSCAWCGAAFHKRRRGAASDAGLYCSRDCAFECRRVLSAIRRVCKAHDEATRDVVRDECRALRRIAAYRERPPAYDVVCRDCRVLMTVKRNGGLHRKVCPACRAENERNCARINKASRRARERGLFVERIDPRHVYDRDGATCRLCGVHTPWLLRGSVHATAPEIDHVVALANGGTHCYANVQLLCRSCNGIKAAK